MRDDTKRPDPGTAWAPYEPSDEAPWDRRPVVYLHRRAGFAATWAEIQRDLKDGPKASIDRLLAGKARADGVPKDFADVAALLAGSAGEPERLKAWWVYRMLFGPYPLTERLALMWHNHFATSIAKVGDAGAMRRQNEIFREHARAPFGKLLAVVTHDPALLLWLDAPANRAGHPNDILARELMELFTLGLSHYTEADVKESARALTGWTVAASDQPVRGGRGAMVPRPDPQSLEPAPGRRGFVLGLRLGDRGRTRQLLDRDGHGRQHHPPVDALRHRRAAPDLRAREPARLHTTVLVARYHRPHLPQRRRLRLGLCRDPRRRPTRRGNR